MLIMKLNHCFWKFRVRVALVLATVVFYLLGLLYVNLSIQYGPGAGEDHGNSRRDLHAPVDSDGVDDFAANSRRFDSYHVNYQRKSLHLSEKAIVRTCQEKTKFVFIKCMKCATETMGSVLRRFGYVRNLSFVLPVKKNIYLGWPYTMTSKDYRPSKTGSYDILYEHAMYNKSIMRKLMPPGTQYITIIREPFKHFKSVFNYFNVANIAKIPGPDTLTEYLHDLDKYEANYQSHDASPIRYCIPDNFSITKNLLSHCLGMPLGFPQGYANISKDIAVVRSYIKELDNDFTLVMIVEYFLESLVLLRRLMCWTTKDILYHSVNKLDYKYKKSAPRRDNVAIYSHWSQLDYMLYDHFNKSLWQKIDAQGEDFVDEVYYFYQVKIQVELYCYPKNNTTGSRQLLSFPASSWGDAFTFSEKECQLFKVYLLELIKQQYDRL